MLRKLPKGAVIGEIWFDRAGNQCYYREDGTICVTTINNEPSLTVQSEKDSCDINKIVSRFSDKRKDPKRIAQDLAMTPFVRTESPQYGDFASLPLDYHEAQLLLQRADESFLELPSAVRKRFENDPGQLIEFINDEANREEAIKLGLIPAPQAPELPQGSGITPSGGSTPPSTDGV